jgi:uncharacterized protein YjbI with pentapeptide repeats
MGENYQDKTESKLIATEDKLRKPPLSANELKMLSHIRINRFLKTSYKLTGITGKSIWDLILLLGVIAIPIVVVIASSMFSEQLNQSNLRVTEQQHQTDIQIATNQQQDATLATYLNAMTNLMLNDHLRQSKPSDEVRTVARAQTLTVLRRLDSDRKLIVLRFLFESSLLSIINMDDAELSGIRYINLRPREANDLKSLILQYADLTHADLENLQMEHGSLYDSNLSFSTLINLIVSSSNLNNVNLSHAIVSNTDFSNSLFVGADLSSADLSNVILRNTDLSNAILSGAELDNVDLSGAKVTCKQLARAKSFKGSSMPDGSKPKLPLSC